VYAMHVRQVVEILSELIQDGATAVQQWHGAEALTVARGIRALLSTYLREQLPYTSIWEEFTLEPQKAEAQLTGVLEMLVEANPGLAQEIDALLGEYRKAVGPPGNPRIRTGIQSNVPVRSQIQDTRANIEIEDDIGKGIYLYGNVKPGSVSVGRGVQAKQAEGSARGLLKHEGIPNGAWDSSSFEDFEITVDTYPGIDQAAKTEIKRQLHLILAMAGKATEKDEDIVVRCLHTIRGMSPDILDALLSKLVDPATEFGLMIKGAAQRLSDETNEQM
jgi:hypothetical protein